MLGSHIQMQPPIWADGFLARSVGRVRIEAVQIYLDQQSEHHGYHRRCLPPVFRYQAIRPKVLAAAHSVFDLTHHVVLSTRCRRNMFGRTIGQEMVRYWLLVADKREFAIDRATILPDHVHMLVRTLPKMTIESCVLALMNNGQHWFAKHFPNEVIAANVNQLWTASAYVGTCGELTTA